MLHKAELKPNGTLMNSTVANAQSPMNATIQNEPYNSTGASLINVKWYLAGRFHVPLERSISGALTDVSILLWSR